MAGGCGDLRVPYFLFYAGSCSDLLKNLQTKDLYVHVYDQCNDGLEQAILPVLPIQYLRTNKEEEMLWL